MDNNQEMVRIAKVLYGHYCGDDKCGDCKQPNCMDYIRATQLVNSGIGDKKEAVRAFATQVLKHADDKAIFQEWYNYEKLGGRLIGLNELKGIIEGLFAELYGEEL